MHQRMGYIPDTWHSILLFQGILLPGGGAKKQVWVAKDSQQNGCLVVSCTLSFCVGAILTHPVRPPLEHTNDRARRTGRTAGMRLVFTASLLVLATRAQVGGGQASGGHDCFLPNENKS